MKIKFFMKSTITLSRALDMVEQIKSRPGYIPRWYRVPVGQLIAFLGDVPVTAVASEDVDQWFAHVHGRELSPYTVDSYGRAIRAFFNCLVQMGHLKASPVRYRLARLPKTRKRAIADDDLERIIQYARRDKRDYAMVLILRDSGCRVGELVSMSRNHLHTERYILLPHGRVRLVAPHEVVNEKIWHRGQALVESSKAREKRWICFNHEATLALTEYLASRLDDIPAVWLNQRRTAAITGSGVSQKIRGMGKELGIDNCHPHAFRHRLAKYLKNKRVDPEIIASLLGHRDVTTYQLIYGITDASELPDYHTLLIAHDG